MQLFYRRVPTVTTMSKRLYRLATMWRVCGCFFIADIKSHELSQARVPWKSFYTLYSLLCASVLFSFRIMQLRPSIQSATEERGTVSNSLLAFMRHVIGLEVIVVFVVMATRSGAILGFLLNARSFETSMTVPPFHRARKQCMMPYVCNIFFFTCMVSYTFYRTLALLIAAYHHMTTSDILVVLYTLVANALYLACDYGNKATARAVCEVFIDYVSIQVDILKRKQESGLNARDVEELRVSMSAIQGLKDEINAVLNPCIVLFCLRAFSVVCSSGYVLLRMGFGHETSALLLFHCLQVAFGLLDLAFMSQTLESETENVKLSLAASITTDSSSAHISQMRFVYNTIEPRQMCLSGGGFFAINARTLMRLAEAVVTYSVILIQTGDTVIHALGPATGLFNQQEDVIGFKKQ
ncbi:uncharacterized protein LOC144104713 [Amblyomma americanum]